MSNTGITNNKNFRKSIQFSTDRKKLIQQNASDKSILKYEKVLVPKFAYGINALHHQNVSYNKDSALFYLRKAAMPEERIRLNLYTTENPHYQKIAEDIKNRLKENLNVEVLVKVLPYDQLMEKSYLKEPCLILFGKKMDYPHPESFLSLFYGKNIRYDNIIGYDKYIFNKLFEEISTISGKEALDEKLQVAEKLLTDDLPAIILWHEKGYQLKQFYVKNLTNSSLPYIDFGKIYLLRSRKLVY